MNSIQFMYNHEKIQELVSFITERNGILDVNILSHQVQTAFALIKGRCVFYCDDFAIRFCSNTSRDFDNIVFSLSGLRQFDNIPFIVCLVTPYVNCLMLANTTFLIKISHSSQELRMDNVTGSFNGSDIMMNFEGIENSPLNFEHLFTSHENYSFTENLARLVSTTNRCQDHRKRSRCRQRQSSHGSPGN